MQIPLNGKDKGFSLLELVIAMAIGLVVLGALSSTFIFQRKRYDVQEQITAMTQTARAAMDMVIAETMMAGYNPTGELQDEDETDTGTFVGIDPISATHFKVYADLNGDGDNADANEIIEYFYDSGNRLLKRGTDGSTPINFAEDVQAFTVTYLDPGDVATTDPSKIRRMEITIAARTEKPDGDFSANGGYRTTTLTSDVKIRNLGLETAYYGGGSTTTTTSIGTTTTTSIGTTTTTSIDTTTTTSIGTTTTTSIDTTTTTTSDSTSSSSTSTSIISTSSTSTTTTSPCVMTVQLDGCKRNGNQLVYAQIRVLVNGYAATTEDNVTVTWKIVARDNPSSVLSDTWAAPYIEDGYFATNEGPAPSPCNSGFNYYVVSPVAINNNPVPISVSVEASKPDCEVAGNVIPVRIP